MAQKRAAGTESIYFFGDNFGFTTKSGGVVDRVVPGSQAEEKGVRRGWRVVAIDNEALPPTTFDSDIAQRLKKAVARGGDCCQVSFSTGKKDKPPSAPRGERQMPVARPVDEAKVQQQQSCLCNLGALSVAERRKNLEALGSLSPAESNAILKDAQVVQGLLGQRGADELSLLLGDKSPTELNQTLNLCERLVEGQTPKPEEVRKADLRHRDSKGNTAMHMARNAKSFERLVDVAESTMGGGTPSGRRRSECVISLFQSRNVGGETPVQAALRHAAASAPKRAELVNFFSDYVPEVMRENIPEVISLLPREERDELLKPKIQWPEVRDLLLGDLDGLQSGYARLSAALRASSPSLEPEDHAGTWTELLAEHCFGVLQPLPEDGSSKGSLAHCEASRERLGAVWKGLQKLLEASAQPTLPKDEAGRLKDMAKGLLIATRGPCSPTLDPREPYREEFTRLIGDLQGRTASLLGDSLKAAIKAEASAAEEIQGMPHDELQGVDTSAASVRGASGRLRMDARLAADPLRQGAGGEVGAALDTPSWVEEQRIDAEVFNDLKRWGCVERASDVVDISRGGGGSQAAVSPVVQEGVTEERLRFCRLHAAWLRGVCSGQQQQIAERLRCAVGLSEPGAGEGGGPWQAGGGSRVTLFRTRAEAKGLPRILEKMSEALEEEVHAGSTRSLLEQLAARVSAKDPDEEERKASALRELLTPACYIVDVNGAEVVVESFADMLALHKHLMSQSLQKDQCQVVRIKNGFSKELSAAEVASKGGYRDLKLWLMFVVGGTRLLAELQVHLRCFYELKRVMHLPYECSRGSFDHPHLRHCWQHDSQLGHRCCGGCTIA